MKRHLLFSFLLITFIVHAQKPVIHLNEESLKRTILKTSQSDVETRLINYHNIPSFSEAVSSDSLINIGLLKQATIFTVCMADNPEQEQNLWELQHADGSIDMTTQAVGSEEKRLIYNKSFSKNPLLVTYEQSFNHSSSKQVSKAEGLYLGNFSADTTKNYSGGLAEILVYPKIFDYKKKQAIASLLALKYGITLTNGFPYCDSRKKVVYDIADKPQFRFHIAGIGREDALNIYQRQSASQLPDAAIAIGLGQIADTNEANPSELSNRDFMIWGTTDASLNLSTATNQPIKTLDRLWRMQVNGRSFGNQPTQVQLDLSKTNLPQELEPNQYLLVIDRKGHDNIDFNHDVTYYFASSNDGSTLHFNNVVWDTDDSGADTFSFALLEDLTMDVAITAPINCTGIESGRAGGLIKGGLPPYTYKVNRENVLVQDLITTADSLSIDHLSAGTYTVLATDRLQNTLSATLTLEGPQPVTLTLVQEHQLKFEQTLTLDATIPNRNDITYQWSLNNEVISDEATIDITEAGLYTITATSDTGCTDTLEIKVNPSNILEYTLYPNSTSDGNYSINILLDQPQDIVVEVYDLTGKYIYNIKSKNKNTYLLNPRHLKTSGIYDVILKTADETVSHKLIVE